LDDNTAIKDKIVSDSYMKNFIGHDMILDYEYTKNEIILGLKSSSSS
jgi:hypothetical protein